MDPIQLRREFLENNHSRIVEALRILSTLRTLDPEQQHHALGAIERLNTLGFETSQIIDLWSEISTLLKDNDFSGRPLTPLEREHLLNTVEELRLRIVSVAVVGTRGSGAPETETVQVDWFNLKEYKPTIEHHSGEIVSAIFKSHVIILLPEIASKHHEQGVTSGLLEIFDRSPSQASWLIDFSSMREISNLLLGIIYGYRESMLRKGGRLGICWLRHGIVPENTMESLRIKFGLIRIGDHWFSSALSGA